MFMIEKIVKLVHYIDINKNMNGRV